MYNTNYDCRYHKDDIFLESDNVTEKEKDIIRHILYKEDLLNIFDIDIDDKFDIFNDILSKLYDNIKNNDFLKECIRKASTKLFYQNEEFGLCVLYSYDFMYLTHNCVSEYLDKGTISEKNINLLKDCINN